MIRKVYYRLTLLADSPLSISGAFSSKTDADVIVDSRGIPFLPASSVAGVLRHAIDSKDKEEALFGALDKSSSAIRVYDFCSDETAVVSNRDNVALEEDNKVAKAGAKFDRQVVDAGACFVGYIEIGGSADNCDAEAEVELLLAKLNAGLIKFGSKTTRGMGAVSLKNCSYQKKVFEPSDVETWLDFDMFNEACWSESDVKTVDRAAFDGAEFKITLAITDAISIREYTTELPDALAGEETAPDYKQLSDIQTGAPIIPGTSWAGAFRAQYRKLSGLKDNEVADLFGTVNASLAQKSNISFSESYLEGGNWKLITRNSIDRYTGGTIDSALFTELAYFGGETELRIQIKNPRAEWLSVLIACLADLNNGFMAVGGLTAVGHGLFTVKEASLIINGTNVDSFTSAFDGAGLSAPDIPLIMIEIKSMLEKGE